MCLRVKMYLRVHEMCLRVSEDVLKHQGGKNHPHLHFYLIVREIATNNLPLFINVNFNLCVIKMSLRVCYVHIKLFNDSKKFYSYMPFRFGKSICIQIFSSFEQAIFSSKYYLKFEGSYVYSSHVLLYINLSCEKIYSILIYCFKITEFLIFGFS